VLGGTSHRGFQPVEKNVKIDNLSHGNNRRDATIDPPHWESDYPSLCKMRSGLALGSSSSEGGLPTERLLGGR